MSCFWKTSIPSKRKTANWVQRSNRLYSNTKYWGNRPQAFMILPLKGSNKVRSLTLWRKQ
jgi:hypothetical protein